jgi:hypothetical protein
VCRRSWRSAVHGNRRFRRDQLLASSALRKDDRPLATPEAAERKLLELANAIEADHVGRLPIGVINMQFMAAGGSSAENRAAVLPPLSPMAG